VKKLHRTICYTCYRPTTSCMCSYISALETQTRFIILMHPKEFKKTKNGTGHFTHLSLKNSEIHIGVDFSKNSAINSIIDDPNNICYVLYPSKDSINLNKTKIGSNKKRTVLFLIDSTWPCSRSILQHSPNIQGLKKLSFTHTKRSNFTFKQQPEAYCLSTIESTLCVLELLNKHKLEALEPKSLEGFLLPFEKMVEYQLSCNK